MKHIEQITSEQTRAEIQRLVESDDMLTTALSRPYAAATGLEEVQPLAPSTSDVEEMPSWMVYLIRKIFETTTRVFRGVSLLSEFRTVYNWLRKRLKGSEDNYIPSVPLDSSKPMHQHLSLLDSRKIDDGLTLTLTDGTIMPLPDGLSLAQLLCSGLADNITELHDSNKGWTMTEALSIFPNAEKILLGCGEMVLKYTSNTALYSFSKCKSLRAPWLKKISNTTDSYLPSYTPIFSGSPLEQVDFPELLSYTGRLFVGGSLPEELNLPKLTNAGTCIAESCTGVKRIIAENVGICNGYSYHPNLIADCPDLEYAYIPNLSAYKVYGANDGAGSLQDMPKLSHLVIGKAPFISTSTVVRFALDNCPNLVLLDIRGDLNQNIYLDHWSPTNALSERLPEFLSNFQTYIADRVADCTGKTALTLTLSAAVYDALQAQEGQTILATLTNKNWTVAQA